MSTHVFAVRGAITVEADDRGQILEATEELLREILGRNELDAEHFISCIFTVTPDLTAEFPAVAARTIGFERVPLLCAQEIPVPGSMPRVIRVLGHYSAAAGHVPQHVYLREARTLRVDLEAAQ